MMRNREQSGNKAGTQPLEFPLQRVYQDKYKPQALLRRRLAFCLLLAILLPNSLAASPGKAGRLYENGEYEAALQEYQRLLQDEPENPKLMYNAGNAAYRAGELHAAATYFSRVAVSPDLSMQQSAYYNLGNVHFAQGAGQSDPNRKMEAWQKSLKNFDGAVKLNPEDADAEYNRNIVRKRLEQLQQQQQQQQKDPSGEENEEEEKTESDSQQQSNDPNESSQQDQSQTSEDRQGDNAPQDSDSQQNQKQSQEQEQRQQPSNEPDQESGEEQQQTQQPRPREDSGEEQAPSDENQARPSAADQNFPEGKMTDEQVRQMLDALQQDEKALIFQPQIKQTQKSADGKFKNW